MAKVSQSGAIRRPDCSSYPICLARAARIDARELPCARCGCYVQATPERLRTDHPALERLGRLLVCAERYQATDRQVGQAVRVGADVATMVLDEPEERPARLDHWTQRRRLHAAVLRMAGH